MTAFDTQVEQVDIKGYEGVYAITSDGKVISYGGKSNHKEDIFLSPTYDKDGYKRVRLQQNKHSAYYRVCRLVALAFIPNPNNFPIVNHIDENKQNDSVENLEWTDNYGNWKHSEHNATKKEQPCVKLTISGKSVCIYPSLMEAARDTGINQGNITNCLKGRCKSVGGYRWEIYGRNYDG